MSKSAAFVPPIVLPHGAKIFTVEEAARYIMALPADTRSRSEWAYARRCIVDLGHGEINVRHVRMAFTRALAHSGPGSQPINN